MLSLSQRITIFLIIINLITSFGDVEIIKENADEQDRNVKASVRSYTEEGEFFYIVAIIYVNYPNIIGCAGAIISAKYVLTTADCVYNNLPEDIYVRGGTLMWDTGRFTSGVSSIIVHENFNNMTLDYNIALLFLYGEGFKYAMERTTLLRVIKIASEPSRYKINAVEAGWGSMRNITADNRLKQSLIKIITHTGCKKIYNNNLTRNMLCGTAMLSDSDCVGDSGGPLVDIDDGTLIGLISKGHSCSGAKQPAIYTDIYELRPWILEAPKKVLDIYIKVLPPFLRRRYSYLLKI